MATLFTHIVDFFRSSHDLFVMFTFTVASFLLISGIDDIALDLYYWFNYLFRRKATTKYQKLSKEELKNTPEKHIAIFVPAWREDEVIDKMITRACATIDYAKYDIFVGVYPNDPKTVDKVMKMSRIYERVHAVVAGHQGPSSKAENLNEIYQGMIRWENAAGIRYDVVVLHDAEDVIHPLSLRVFNYFIPSHDMVQLPVYPLETPHTNVIHWTYCDEFAENHTKDLVARSILSGFTPSAGVGTGYNRWLLEFAGTSFARNMFRKNSLTEDYDMALRLGLGEAKLLFLYKPFGIDIATWAYFPHSFATSVRQKTRWLIGICLQSWKNYGWLGNFRFRLTLYRDRKAVLSNLVNVLAYVVLLYVILYELAVRGLSSYGRLTPIVAVGSTLWYIILVDTVLMIWRFGHRFLTVKRIYGSIAGLLSILRYPVSNVVNFNAATRALRKYLLSRVNGTRIPWDKTVHRYPSMDEHRVQV